MGDVIDFTQRRLEKHQRPPEITMEKIMRDSTDWLLGEWEKMARHNRLNDYFKRSLPNLIEYGSKVNFMTDLTELAGLELKLDIFPILFAPGTSTNKQLGWIIKYRLDDFSLETPEMASEAYARSFGMLLYLKVKHDALAAGLMGSPSKA